MSGVGFSAQLSERNQSLAPRIYIYISSPSRDAKYPRRKLRDVIIVLWEWLSRFDVRLSRAAPQWPGCCRHSMGKSDYCYTFYSLLLLFLKRPRQLPRGFHLSPRISATRLSLSLSLYSGTFPRLLFLMCVHVCMCLRLSAYFSEFRALVSRDVCLYHHLLPYVVEPLTSSLCICGSPSVRVENTLLSYLFFARAEKETNC